MRAPDGGALHRHGGVLRPYETGIAVMCRGRRGLLPGVGPRLIPRIRKIACTGPSPFLGRRRPGAGMVWGFERSPVIAPVRRPRGGRHLWGLWTCSG